LNGATTESKRSDINKLCKNLGIIDFNLPCAEKASEIYRELKIRNKMIEFRDILIGATALMHGIPIATLNIKHFERIAGIQII
jgi:predicted nucleic acid-binding protein